MAVETGLRQGDLIRAPWTAYDGDAIRIKTSKTGAKVVIPATMVLKAALADAPRKATTILVAPKGRPWSQSGFQSAVGKAMRCANMPTRDQNGVIWNDLRGTAVTRLFLAGCTVAECAAITGHSIASAQRIIDRYLAREPLARAAIKRLDEYRSGAKRQPRKR